MSNLFGNAKTKDEVLLQMIGAGSTCWENLESAGVFNDTFAIEIFEKGKARLQQIEHEELVKALSAIPSYRQVCEAMEGRKLTDEEFESMRSHALMTLDEIALKFSDSDDIHTELEERDG